MYKGSAQECQSALSLLWFFVVKFVAPEHKDHWEPFVKSFGALMEIHRWFRKVRFQDVIKSSDLKALEDLQFKHATFFLEAYGEAKVRPKFHFRLHLPFALGKIRKYIDCEPHASWNIHLMYSFTSFFVFQILIENEVLFSEQHCSGIETQMLQVISGISNGIHAWTACIISESNFGSHLGKANRSSSRKPFETVDIIKQ